MSDSFEMIGVIADAITIATPVYKVGKAMILAHFVKKGQEEDEAIGELKNANAGDLADILLQSGRISYYEYGKLRNFAQIVEKANEYYSRMGGRSEKIEYDWDWLIRFYEAAEYVSDEKLQNLWAEILAGEIGGHAKYSFKTLDVLKNIGREDALLFENVAKCMIHIRVRMFLPDNEDYLQQNGLTYGDVMRLSEIGLMHEVSANLNLDLNTQCESLFNNRDFMVLITLNKPDVHIDWIPIRNYALTRAGTELAFLLQEADLSLENMMSFASLFNASQDELRASVHKTIPDGSGDDFTSIYTKDLLTGEEMPLADMCQSDFFNKKDQG